MSLFGWWDEWTSFEQGRADDRAAAAPDPWDGPPPGTPAPPGPRARRPEDDPAPYCPDSHKHAGGRCWASGCPNGGEPL